ncbi:hypothetical protein [Corynebacterium falsenii]
MARRLEVGRTTLYNYLKLKK